MNGTPDGEPPLVIRLNGPGWHAELVVQRPDPVPGKPAEFEVPLSQGRSAQRHHLVAQVWYTSARNLLGTGWDDWFVKIYRCRDSGEAELLRRHLGQQAGRIQLANAQLPGAARIQVDPPWAAVPVHIVRCDGLQQNIGPVRTELAASAEDIANRVRQALPPWVTGDPPQPERYLLAISPKMAKLNWDGFHPWPATEHLRDFERMAIGLDTLHRLGTVHCDIKPDNVCQYNIHDVSGYVLIDTDSVCQVDPPPFMVRPTPPYHHRALAEWFADPKVNKYGVDADVLRAHDRFGFAVVVLTALAGKEWVDRVLLRSPVTPNMEGVRGDARTADDRDAVVTALRQLWPDTDRHQWAPLIEALAEPFGRAVESPKWSAQEWLGRVLEAEGTCVVGQTPKRPFERSDPAPYRDQLDSIWERVNRGPARRQDLARRGYEAVEHAGLSAARRSATRAATLAAFVAVPVGVLVYTLLNALGL
ncbi:hypothetical protein ACQP2P_26690 [Dactylosporangium sp. CA-139114]|uniref:hypothetical protein n=1 Tax=Dactylosporangium sp. CA-139114 TaxID=3239931 RepID=UPI003D95BE30